MRKELETLAQIDDFLDGEITKEELIQAVGNDENIDFQIESQHVLRGAIQKEAFILNSQKSLAKFKLFRAIKILSLTILSATAITIAILLFGKDQIEDKKERGTPLPFGTETPTILTEDTTHFELDTKKSFESKNKTVEVDIQPAKVPLKTEIKSKEKQSAPIDSSFHIYPKNETTKTGIQIEEIDTRGASLNLVMNRTTLFTKKQITVEFYNGNGKNVLETTFNAGLSSIKITPRQKEITYKWFLKRNKDLDKGIYTAKFYYQYNLITSKSFEVF